MTNELADALRRCSELLARSEDSDWTPWTAAELRAELATLLDAIEQGREPDLDRLRLLFLPAGPVQETALASGWPEEMRALAEMVDRFLGDA